MNERTHDRIFAGLGIASVALNLGGFAIGAASGQAFPTITSTPGEIADALGKTAGTGVWIGAYASILSVGCFLAFAAWACTRLGGGVVGQVGRAAAASYASLTLASLAVMDTVLYRGGKGMSLDLGTSLITLNMALYVCTWFSAAFFLLAVGALAVSLGRRAVGWSAVAVAGLMLVLTAASVDNLGQLSFMLFLTWTVYASVALARRPRSVARRAAVAQAA